MRKLQILILNLVLLILSSCKSESIQPFELSVIDYNYSLAYSILYTLSEKELTITFRGELENEKDSVLYSTIDLPNRETRKLSKINLDSLKTFYSNPCISDGDIKDYRFTKDGISKQVRVQNYYQKELSPVIELINNIVPEKFKMYHNKDQLLSDQKWCEDDTKEFLRKKGAE